MAAKGLGRSALDVSLSWLLRQPGVATAVVGPRTPVQLKEILDAQLTPLPPEIANALDDVSFRRLVLEDFEVLVRVAFFVLVLVVKDLERGHFVVRFVESVLIDFESICYRKKCCFH